MDTSNYQSDIIINIINKVFNYIDNLNIYYDKFINSYTTSLIHEDVLEMMGSPLSCFFNEYLARKFNAKYNSVVLMENYFQEKLKKNLENHLGFYGEIVINITSCTYAIVCSLLTLINPGDKVLILDNCCGGYWSQGSVSSKGISGFPSLLFEINTFHWPNKYEFDYYELEKSLIEYKPDCLLLGFSSYTNLVDYKKIRQLCDEYNCYFIFDGAHVIGLMLAGNINHCFNDAHITVGSTYKTIKGPRGGLMITNNPEYKDLFQKKLTNIQVERGLNLVAASYLAIDHCFSDYHKDYLNKGIAIAQNFYNFFTDPMLNFFNIKPLMTTEVPMILIDLGSDATPFIKTLWECGWLCGSFKIHNKYSGLRIITNNMTEYSEEDIEILFQQMKIILLNKNLSWSEKEKIRNKIMNIINKDPSSTISRKPHQSLKENVRKFINQQNLRICFTTASLFTDVSLKCQGDKMARIDMDSLNLLMDDHPYSPSSALKTFQTMTIDGLKNNLSLKEIFCDYNIPSATGAILGALLTLINKGDKVLIMAENHGGHYSQGSISGSGACGLPKILFNVKEFFLNNNNLLDYDILEQNLQEFRPQCLLLGFSSYGGLLDYKKIRQLCNKYNCYFISDCSHNIGLMISGIIPHCFNEAHITVASTYKTIPAVRGGIMITNNYQLYKNFQEKSFIILAYRGLNLIASVALGIEECFSEGYKLKMQRTLEIVKFIEKYFIDNKLGKPTVDSKIHMATIDLGFDVKEVFSNILECHMDIGTFYVPHTNRYGLRFICTTVGILGYTNGDILMILNNLKIIIEKKQLTEQEKILIKKNIINVTEKYKMFN
jgi:glycine hydroxymethyltransferase